MKGTNTTSCLNLFERLASGRQWSSDDKAFVYKRILKRVIDGQYREFLTNKYGAGEQGPHSKEDVYGQLYYWLVKENSKGNSIVQQCMKSARTDSRNLQDPEKAFVNLCIESLNKECYKDLKKESPGLLIKEPVFSKRDGALRQPEDFVSDVEDGKEPDYERTLFAPVEDEGWLKLEPPDERTLDEIAKRLDEPTLKKKIPVKRECRFIALKLFGEIKAPLTGKQTTRAIRKNCRLPYRFISESISETDGDSDDEETSREFEDFDSPIPDGLPRDYEDWNKIADDLIDYVCSKGKGGIGHSFKHYLIWIEHGTIKNDSDVAYGPEHYSEHFEIKYKTATDNSYEAQRLTRKLIAELVLSQPKNDRIGREEVNLIFKQARLKLKNCLPDFVTHPDFEESKE